MTNAVTTAAARLAEARVAHDQAVARHAQALDTAARARDRHETATRQRQELLASASAGGNVTEEDLKRAGVAAADAKDTLELHRSIATGALSRVHEAEIAVLAAMVADHDARTDMRRLAAIGKAQLVDERIAAARVALAEYQAEIDKMVDLHNETIQFGTVTMVAALAHNPTLNARHPSERPKMRPVPVGRSDLAVELRLTTANIGGPTTRPIPSLATMVGGSPTSPEATPATAASATEKKAA